MRVALVCLILIVGAIQAAGHGERRADLPDGSGEVPELRLEGPYTMVCKQDTPERVRDYPAAKRFQELLRWTECMDYGHRHVQAAVDAVPGPGHRILIQPGLYQEEPSIALHQNATGACAGLADQKVLTYEQHQECPFAHNMIAVMGDGPDEDTRCTTERLCRLQIEGTGVTREDVILDANWTFLNALRADRADGFVVHHLTAQRTDFNSVYIIETDGFRIDDVLTRWNYAYGFLTFAVDHGLYVDCESYGNGDSGIYPGSASDLFGARPSIEITRCDSHHNALGYSGTAGNSVYAHHNKFHHNAAGVATDSLFPDHPGLPQDSARFVANEIYSNNENYYDNWLPDGPCHKPLAERGIEEGVVCPVVPLPVGTGLMIAGGNNNRVNENFIYDNWRYGTMLFGVPAVFRGEDGGIDLFCMFSGPDSGCVQPDPADLQGDAGKQFDTSHDNWFVGNSMGITPDGQELPNGFDHWWDEEGRGNCWMDNTYAGGQMRTDPNDPFIRALPPCQEGMNEHQPPHPRLATIVPCNDYKAGSNTHPDGCEWMNDPEAP